MNRLFADAALLERRRIRTRAEPGLLGSQRLVLVDLATATLDRVSRAVLPRVCSSSRKIHKSNNVDVDADRSARIPFEELTLRDDFAELFRALVTNHFESSPSDLELLGDLFDL